jgi:sulfatase modifying factor 1
VLMVPERARQSNSGRCQPVLPKGTCYQRCRNCKRETPGCLGAQLRWSRRPHDRHAHARRSSPTNFRATDTEGHLLVCWGGLTAEHGAWEMSHSTSHASAALLIVAISASACDMITGGGSYSEVSHCTGSLCGVCPTGQTWESNAEVCVEDSVWCTAQGQVWDSNAQSCLPAGTCTAGMRFDEGTGLCVAECSENTSPCGTTCCEHMQYCITDTNGVPRCSRCERADLVCGEVCCESGATCTDPKAGVCSASWGVSQQSCAAGLKCGGASCCASLSVAGGTFPQGAMQGWDYVETDESPERQVTVSSFSLDKYEVTVGRFMEFVASWDYKPPPAGAGAHPRISGSGWRTTWNSELPKSIDDFAMRASGCNFATGFSDPSDPNNALYPMNCVSWYEAFLFCAWDGGRLPTESEWEYAATGGSQNRFYPWGDDDPVDLSQAVFLCSYAPPEFACSWEDIATVGQTPAGIARWGHLDMAGNVWEWVLDVYAAYPSGAVTDYAKTDDVPTRVMRGGGYDSNFGELRTSNRESKGAGNRSDNLGFRCARDH